MEKVFLHNTKVLEGQLAQGAFLYVFSGWKVNI